MLWKLENKQGFTSTTQVAVCIISLRDLGRDSVILPYCRVCTMTGREGPGFTVTSSVASTQIRMGSWLFGGWLFFQTTWLPSCDPAMKNTALGYNTIALRKWKDATRDDFYHTLRRAVYRNCFGWLSAYPGGSRPAGAPPYSTHPRDTHIRAAQAATQVPRQRTHS